MTSAGQGKLETESGSLFRRWSMSIFLISLALSEFNSATPAESAIVVSKKYVRTLNHWLADPHIQVATFPSSAIARFPAPT